MLAFSLIALIVTSIPYFLGAGLATDERVFGGFVYAVEDCYAYLAHMREGANGAWLFVLPYTPEIHPPRLFYLFHLLLGKLALLLPGSDPTIRMVWVYHAARLAFGLVLLLTIYRFLAACTEQVVVRRMAWLIVTFGGGLGWLLVVLGQPGWLDSMPLDLILPEGFTFLVLYAFPHIALARTLLLLGLLSLLKAWGIDTRSEALHIQHATRNTQHVSRFTFHVSRIPNLKWSIRSGLLWLAMGLIVPFYVMVAWAVTGTAWLVCNLRERRILWQEGLLVGGAALISAPIVAYNAWVFSTDPIYATWAAQNRILSPHPLHYLAAYGVLLVLAAFAVRDAWREKGLGWLALTWVGIVPALVYLPFNLQRRLVEGVQIPLSLLAALGITKISNLQSPASNLQPPISNLQRNASVLLAVLSLTNALLVAGNCLSLRGQPAPIYRAAGEVAALDWLDERVKSDDVVLAAYQTGNYLPARVGARAFVGHGPESVHADEKKALVARFFGTATDDAWRRHLLKQYSVDYVFWGPTERALGAFDPGGAGYLRPVYARHGYTLFEVTLYE